MSESTGTCYSGKNKKPLPGMPRDSSEWVFTKINGFPGFGSISRFGSKNLSNPKNDKTKDDAMVCVYPLECPKPIISLNIFGKSRELVQSDPKSRRRNSQKFRNMTFLKNQK